MGYHTTLTCFDLELKKGLTKKKFLETWKKAMKKNEKLVFWDDLSVHKVHNTYNNKRGICIELGDYYRKTSCDDIEDEIAPFLAQYVSGDSVIEGIGDDIDDQWKIEFNGKGSYKSKTGRITYEDVYEEFIMIYSNILPPRLLSDLKKWRVTEEI